MGDLTDSTPRGAPNLTPQRSAASNAIRSSSLGVGRPDMIFSLCRGVFFIQTMFSSGRTTPPLNRWASSCEMSTNGDTRKYKSRITSPMAGPIRKPCPENPVA